MGSVVKRYLTIGVGLFLAGVVVVSEMKAQASALTNQPLEASTPCRAFRTAIDDFEDASARSMELAVPRREQMELQSVIVERTDSHEFNMYANLVGPLAKQTVERHNRQLVRVSKAMEVADKAYKAVIDAATQSPNWIVTVANNTLKMTKALNALSPAVKKSTVASNEAFDSLRNVDGSDRMLWRKLVVENYRARKAIALAHIALWDAKAATRAALYNTSYAANCP